MRGLFTLLGMLLVAFLIVGYVRGWYTITRDASSDPNLSHYEIDINRGKINQDVKSTGERISDAIGSGQKTNQPK